MTESVIGRREPVQSSRSPRSKAVLVIMVCLVVCGGSLTNHGGGNETETPSPDPLAFRDLSVAPVPDIVDGLSRLVRIEGNEMLVQTEEGALSFLPGVNLSSSLPGSNPQDPAIDAEHYETWFPQIAKAGFQVIRVEGLRQAAFYRELEAYNLANPQDPLFLFHGVDLPEQALRSERDLWHPTVYQRFIDSIDQTISAANGGGGADATGESYNAAIGQWIVGWIVGGNLDPHVATQTDEANPGVSFRGRFIKAIPGATATEVFLAEAMDRAASSQAGFGHMTPVAFNNSAATDPIVHRLEPNDDNDMVQVDANNIVAVQTWAGGTFASYEADPFYPDFQQFEPGIADFRYNGQSDPYAGYLNQLAEHHSTMPTLISRFGVASGHAAARSGPLGRNQGGFDEVTQMAVNAEMLDTIADLGLSGGFIASWVDEWNRTAWSTEKLDVPARRRSMWKNAWAADSHLGVIAVEPGQMATVTIDGSDREWDSNGSELLYDGQGALRTIKAVHDEGWLYLSLRFDNEDRLSHGAISLGFDVIDGAAGVLPTGEPEQVADYALLLTDGQVTLMAADHANANMLLGNQPEQSARSATDRRSTPENGSGTERVAMPESGRTDSGVIVGFADGTLEPSEQAPPEPVRPASEPSASPQSPVEKWQPQTLIVSESYEHPTTGAQVPVETTVPGNLAQGTTDRTDPLFDSRASWQVSGSHIEVRLPWQGIGLSDPSNRMAYRVQGDKTVTTSKVERILLTVAVGGRLEVMTQYAWEPWTEVSWHQVPKNGLDLVTRVAERTMQEGVRDIPEPALAAVD